MQTILIKINLSLDQRYYRIINRKIHTIKFYEFYKFIQLTINHKI